VITREVDEIMSLEEKLRNKTAKLGVIGLGYVGLPLAVEKALAGYNTIGYDIQSEKVKNVNSGVNYIGDVVDKELKEIVGRGLLMATSNVNDLSKADVICICVPTPLDDHQQPIIDYVESSTRDISKFLRRDMLIILESTTYPGTTEELIKPILESSGLKCGEDFYLAFSPERVDPGNLIYKTKNTPKVVGGVTKNCTEMAALLYESILQAPIHRVSSPAVAEMEKILENTYRNVNIGLINELAILANKMNIDIWEVIDAAKSKPYGFQAFYPGPGLGGHCIPLDPYYLSWKAREYGFHTSMIESSMMINDKMPEYVVERASKILNKYRKSINGSKILILGVAYKQDIDDYRESPALKVIEHLNQENAIIEYYDPHVAKFKHKNLVMKSINSFNAIKFQEFDLIIITTAHTDIEYEKVIRESKVIFDTKNALKKYQHEDKIIKL
jgi:UDP-N-acetyl-D-glucosamine dehydrogenase